MSHENPAEPPYIDRPDLPTVFANRFRLLHWDGHSAYLELAETRPKLSGPNQSTLAIFPVARLALSPAVALDLHSSLSQMLTSLEQQGVLKHALPEPTKKQ
jgi:hypothetical protein